MPLVAHPCVVPYARVMPRPPRLQYPGAVYHVTARGVQQAPIFVDDHDRVSLLKLLARALHAREARVFAFCLMGNHYHFVLQTQRANLSVLMQEVNSGYCMAFNQRHARRGHVLEGRFKALHVDRDAYLLEVCRYVELNPVRAGLVQSPGQWRWSSYRAHVGSILSPAWLASEELLALQLGRSPRDATELAIAQRCHAAWVAEGHGVKLWKKALRCGLYVGDDAFVERVKRLSG